MVFHIRILSWALVFISRLPFPPEKSIATICMLLVSYHLPGITLAWVRQGRNSHVARHAYVNGAEFDQNTMLHDLGRRC